MTRLLALDPGSTHTGWVLLDADTGAVLEHGKDANEDLLAGYRVGLVNEDETLEPRDQVVLEFMSPRGMLTSEHEFDALWWGGRLTEALERWVTPPVVRITRQEVKYKLLGASNVKGSDAALRSILIDRYGQGGGKSAAVGVKAAPGPLYGLHRDAWSALAVACAYQDDARDVETERAQRAEKKRAEAAKKAGRAA